jgi:hypothetical protein
MRAAHVLAVAAALTSAATLSLPASAAEVCDRSCVGGENCTRTPDVTVGRGVREPDVQSRSGGVYGNLMWKLGENGAAALT